MSDLIPIVTPIGKLYYVQITGQGKKNYNEDGFVFTATLHLTGDKAEALKAKIGEVLGEVAKDEHLKSLGYKELLEDDEGVYTPSSKTTERDKSAKPTGITSFSFSTSTVIGEEKKPKKISVYNSAFPKPQKLNLGDKTIGNGSEGAISGTMKRYKQKKGAVGVSLFLNAVQLSKFIEYTEDAGFSGVEGGYTGEDEDGIDTSTMETEAVKTAEAPKSKPKL